MYLCHCKSIIIKLKDENQKLLSLIRSHLFILKDRSRSVLGAAPALGVGAGEGLSVLLAGLRWTLVVTMPAEPSFASAGSESDFSSLLPNVRC